MLRPQSLLPALAAVVVSLGTPWAAVAMPAPSLGEAAPSLTQGTPLGAHRPRPAPESSPLAVTIDALAPSYVPRKGPIRITGSVTNEDEAAWSRVNVYAFLSAEPMRTAGELAEATDADPAADVGARITAPGTYSTLDRLAPGESAQFSIKVPHSALGVSEPGVYWFGVHALGEGPEGRLEGADGRARTFLPLVAPTRRAVDTALVVPLRRGSSYAADGRLDGVEAWTRALAPGGRLGSLVDFGASAGVRPLTWLLDPALPDAVHALTVGNPPRSLDPTGTPDPADPSDPAAPDPSPAASPSASPGDDASPEELATAAAGEAGTSWLARLHETLRRDQVLALPYGDVDVSAAAQHNPALYELARKRSGTSLEPWRLPMSPAVAPPDGYLAPAGIRAAGDTTVLVSDRMFPDGAPAVARTAGARLVPTSSGAATGGPAPGDPLSLVGLRQRILSEAALRLLEPRPRPLVVLFPQRWSPGTATGFFEGLDADWLHLTTVSDIASRRGREVAPDRLDYPRKAAGRELDAANFASSQELIRAGETLQNVLADNDRVASVVADQALSATSYAGRRRPDASRASADRSRAWIERQLEGIGIEAPPQVTLSSASGRFSATVTNALDQPVSVRIVPRSDGRMNISGPETVEIGPHGRTTVLLTASTESQGVHNVRLVLTDSEGTQLGSSDTVPIRSAQVSVVIWVILGTGVALLFGAIAVRLFRRVRAAARAAKRGATA